MKFLTLIAKPLVVVLSIGLFANCGSQPKEQAAESIEGEEVLQVAPEEEAAPAPAAILVIMHKVADFDPWKVE